MRVEAFDFQLPQDLIALRPARPRDSARLLQVSEHGVIAHGGVADAARLFRPGDLLVFNDTRVIAARLQGVRERDEARVAIEATLLKRLDGWSWTALAKPGKRLQPGDRVRFGVGADGVCLLGELDATIVAKGEEGVVTLRFDLSGPVLDAAINEIGAMPLPPYIAAKRDVDDADRSDYQTVYAQNDGAVAAPTAGLHFTPELLQALERAGVETTRVTLHVGAGTFLPVKVEDTSDHKMHAEWREVSQAAAEAINRAKLEGRRVIAIGTTALRSLESAADENGRVRAEAGDTSIFISPGYRFRVVDGLWTNFHLPRSTLFMLVCAFAGLERMQAAYAEAIAHKYRFYSYGDASLLWRAS